MILAVFYAAELVLDTSETRQITHVGVSSGKLSEQAPLSRAPDP